LEASALTHAGRRGLLARRTPLLKLQGDERLISLVRDGNPGAFDTIVDRYQSRLLGFCRQMLHSTEDAEDVLQEVFVNAYRAMLADSREINLRPWLYRIARNRCLNHLRRPTADAQESMDAVPMVEAGTTHERVHNREEFRQLLTDVSKLPETQRSALLLREMDAMSYEEIAHAMDTTVPSVKSLLVRARISLAEASQARLLTCGEVRLELAEAAEGLAKASGPVRRHVRDCEECSEFRSQIRSDTKVLAALSPIGPLVALKAFLGSKLGFGGGGAAGAGAGGAAGGAGAAGAGTFGGGALAGGAAGGGLSAVTSAVGAKAVAGVVTAAVLTAGAVEVKHQVISSPAPAPQTLRAESFASKPDTAVATSALPMAPSREAPAAADSQPLAEPAPVTPAPAPDPPPAPEPTPAPDPAPAADPAQDPAGSTTESPPATGLDDPQAASSSSGSTSVATTTSPHPSGETAVVTVGDPAPQGSTGTPEPPPTPPTAGGGGSTDPAGPPPAG
jgi:RNA polymerase sigma factor (sigma-70 family)